MKSSWRCLASALWPLFLVCASANLSMGQGSKQTSEYEPIKDQDRDNPQARDQWFMRGRTAPNGESAALLRYQAYQQKLQLRRQRFAARAIVAVPHMSSSGWNPLGPAPLASDATGGGFQDYHQVSGRTTAVAIDPADTTGNTVYIGGAHGGVWKSTNAGPASASPASVVWTPVLDYESTLAVGAIAIQPGNTDPTKSVILVGTGEPNSSADSYYGLGILRSADGGQTWTLVQSSNGGARPFAGMGFSKIAFNSTPGKTNVVVAAAAAAETGITLGLDTTGNNRGLYYSLDSGVTWNYATVQDSGVTLDPGSATSVVYNQTAGMFFAALRYHGFYSSTDGITWSRLASQPASLTTGLCPTPHSSTCPIYRAEMTVVPGRNELYTWVVALDTTATEVDRGIWSRNATTGAWAQIADSGITNCESSSTDGCGAQQGSYNLELAAVPNGSTATDLYPGAINIYKCTINNPTATSPGCASQFMNLTHVYGCNPLSSLAHVHPDQHALDFMLAGSPAKAVMYFANDGGIYRAVDGYTGLTTGSCSSGTNSFDSLNGTIGSMTQFVWFSVHPTDANTLLGGTQDNGSPATTSATTSTRWGNVQGGDGGYNAISPANGTDWYAAGPDVPPGSLSINHCTAGLSCNNSSFTPVVSNNQVGTDDGAFYFPYMLDPQAPTRLIIGTCRVWRGGPATSASGTYTALSNNFDKGSATACAGNEINLVRSLAAGGLTDANGSKVIYAGTDGLGGSTSPAGGRVFVTTTGAAPMTDLTGSINPTEYPVSGIAVDTSDATGQTAFVTIMGFHVNHVFKTTNAGASWTNFTSNLPDSPADTVVVDPQAHVVYVGTDVGVFSSSTASASWTEVGPLAAAGNTGYLPNVPVTALAIFNSGGKKLLRASTYGRGIWEYNLSTTADYQIAISNPTLTIFPTQTATFNGTLTALNGYTSPVTLSCSGTLTPTNCTPSPTPLIPTASPAAAAFTVGASGAVGDYPFNVHGVGADAATTTHDAAVTLHIVDFGLGAPSPASVSVQQGNTSSGVAFVVTGAGSFNGTATLACPASGMPTGVTCTFSPSASVSALPATVTLTFKTTASTPPGTTSITISATTPNAAAAKTQGVNLTVTAPTPDYTLAISNSPVSATVNTSGTFNGTLKALNGYASAVNLSCGTGAPPTCTVSPASVTPTVAGAPFTVTVQSNLAQAYNFSVSGTGTDAVHIAHATPVVFNSLFTFTVADTSTTQSVKAGQTASYSLTVTPVGSNTFPSAVSLTCSNWSPSQPAGAACSAVTQVSAGASGVQTVTLNITTAGLGRTQIRPVAKNVAPFFLWVSAVGMVIGGFGRKSWARKKGMVAIGLVVLLASAIMLPACGAGGGGGGGGGGGISVNVSPKTASPLPTQSQQFTAQVNGNTNQQVTWQVSGVTGGNSTVGTIDTTGLYTAPATVPSPNPVAVSAVSQADVTKSDTAMVTIKTPTPSGTYTVTVTVTAGTVTQTTTAVLIVQ